MTADLNISWTQLRAHMECRQKAFLLRSGKRNPAGNVRSYFHGMVVDSIMRDWLADPARRPGEMVGRVEQYIIDGERKAIEDGDGIVKWRNPADRAELTTFCTELLVRLEPILDTLVLPYEFFSAHRFRQPITVPHLDGTPTTIYLRGEMDLLVREGPDVWAVWDLKGTKDDTYWRKVLGQLVFYDLAVLATHKRGTTRVGLIQPMCKQPVLQWQLTAEHRRQMGAAIIRMAHDIWRSDTACKDGTDGCTVCDVRHACQRYAPVGNTIPFGPTTLGTALRQAITTQEATG